MAKVESKTKATTASVKRFLDAITDKEKRADYIKIIKLIEEASGEKAKMWGPAIVGFGNYHYTLESGREGDSALIGFASRKQTLALSFMRGVKNYPALLKKLGKFKTAGWGKLPDFQCLYVKSLEDIDLSTLKELVKLSFEDLNKHVKKQKETLSKK